MSIKLRQLLALLIFTLSLSVRAEALTDVCGDGWNNVANAFVFGACPVGYINAQTGVGCDKLCLGLDADGDAYATTGLMPWGNGLPLGSDCDDTNPGIYPGRTTTSGCPVGEFRTCQVAGTYDACQPIANFGSTLCTNRYYIDPVAGNNANPGTFASPWADQRMFSTNDVNPGGHHAPVAGDCFIYKAGTNATAGTVSGQLIGVHLQGKNCSMAQPCRIMGLPGVRPVFDYAGVAGNHINPFYSLNSDYWVIQDLLVTGNYCDTNAFTTDAGCVYISSDDVTLRDLVVINNDGVRPNNLGGVISHSTTNFLMFNSVLGDNYDTTSSGQNNANYTDFRSINAKLINVSSYYSTPASSVAAAFKQKHANVNSSISFVGGKVQGANWAAYEISGPNHTIVRTIVSDSEVSYVNADLGGPGYMIGGKVFEDSTVINSRLAEIRPHKAWNLNGTAAADPCSGDPVLTNWNFSRVVIVDNKAVYLQDSEMVTLHNYGPDQFYTDTVTGNKLLFSNGCTFNTLGTPIVYSIFRSNNGDLSCSGRGNLGSAPANFLAWQAAGFDVGTVNLDPVLDGSFRATTGSCSGKGYRQLGDVGVPAGGGGGPISKYIRRVIRSFF